jgi:HEAT repeat protein
MKNLRHYYVGSLIVLVIGVCAFLFLRSMHSGPAHEPRSGSHTKSVASGRVALETSIVSQASRISEHSTTKAAAGGSIHNSARNSTPPTIRRIVNTDGTVSFNERLAAVRSLGTKLTTEEVDGLYDFLLLRNRDSLVKNDVFNKLRAQDTLPSGLIDVLAAIYEDKQQEPPLRHYALQHAALGYAKASSEDKAQIQNLLWAGSGEISSSIAGTALLGLKRLAEIDPNLDGSKVGETALNISTNPEANELARITAIRICAELGAQEVLSSAVTLSESGQSISLRMAAIATVGDLGGAAQKELLQRLAMDSDRRVQTAAQSALQRLQRRTNT